MTHDPIQPMRYAGYRACEQCGHQFYVGQQGDKTVCHLCHVGRHGSTEARRQRKAMAREQERERLRQMMAASEQRKRDLREAVDTMLADAGRRAGA